MVLSNKLGLSSSAELCEAEERLTKARAAELFVADMLADKEPSTFDTLAFIHRQFFQDVYDFAGEVRGEGISKGGLWFASALYLGDALKQIEAMPRDDFAQIVRKYVEMNVAHPFREGNGRSMRIWVDHILKSQLGLVVDWQNVDKQDYLLAMERSPVRDVEIRVLLEGALTDKTRDRELYMKGIDASYSDEGYSSYIAADLSGTTGT